MLRQFLMVSKISISVKRFFISTMSAFPSGLFTHEGSAHMASSRHSSLGYDTKTTRGTLPC